MPSHPDEPTFLGQPLRVAILVNLTRSYFPRSTEEIATDFVSSTATEDQVKITLDQMVRDQVLQAYTHSTRQVLVYHPLDRARH